MNNTTDNKLTFRIESSHGHIYHILDDFMDSINHICIQNLVLEPCSNNRIVQFEATCDSLFLRKNIELCFPPERAEQFPYFSVSFGKHNSLIIDFPTSSGQSFISAFFAISFDADFRLKLSLDKITEIGCEEINHGVYIAQLLTIFNSFISQTENSQFVSVLPNDAIIKIDIIRWIIHTISPSLTISLNIHDGHFQIRTKNNTLFIRYTENKESTSQTEKTDDVSSHVIEIQKFFSKSHSEDADASSSPISPEFSLSDLLVEPLDLNLKEFDIKSDTPPSKSLSFIMTPSQCPTIDEIHQALHVGQRPSIDILKKGIEEAKNNLPPNIVSAFRYMIHKWFPETDEDFMADMPTLSDNPFILAIYEDYHRNNKNHIHHFETIESFIRLSCYPSHHYIIRQLQSIELMCKLSMHQMAKSRLDIIQYPVLNSGSVHEKICFIHALQATGQHDTSIRLLKRLIRHDTDHFVEYGYELLLALQKYHHPIEDMVKLARSIIRRNHAHLPTLELISSITLSENSPKATDFTQQFFDQIVARLKYLLFQTKLAPNADSTLICNELHTKAIELANLLEKRYESLSYLSMLIVTLRTHITLEPNNFSVFEKLTQALQKSRNYYDIISLSNEYLTKYESFIHPYDKVSIYLLLHTIYDQYLDKPEKAIEQINKARELSALDPRVIKEEIERCKRHHQDKEQVGLRLALIDAVSPEEAVTQTLELVRLYESLNANDSEIIDILRKTNARSPNHSQILLELRRYLRKASQNYELANVLEKLARITKDMQLKKTILLEASEVQEKLGNIPTSQSLYHEAQLCSPINPDNKLDFIGLKLGNKVGPDSLQNDNETDDKETDSVSSISVVNSETEQPHIETISNEELQSQTTSSETISIVSYVTNGQSFSQNSQGELPAISHNEPVVAPQPSSPDDNLNKLLDSIQGVPEDKIPPRKLQEIGCIYLYDKDDRENAMKYLEKASKLSEEIEYGEQTLNALEDIYQYFEMYSALAVVYEKKIKMASSSENRRKYGILLAQLDYEHLNRTDHAIRTLTQLLDKHPSNYTILQLLAHIYEDTHAYDKAIQTLEKILLLVIPSSKQYSIIQLKLVTLYLNSDQYCEAKRILLNLILNDDLIDKFAIIEKYKSICREHDEWEELLNILLYELSLSLHIPKDQCDLTTIDWLNQYDLSEGYTTHTIREYADILYYKLNRFNEVIPLYLILDQVHPEDEYPKNVLLEIADHHSENAAVISALIDIYTNLDKNRLTQSSVRDETFITRENYRTYIEDVFDLVCEEKFDKAETELKKLFELPFVQQHPSQLPFINTLKKHLQTKKQNTK